MCAGPFFTGLEQGRLAVGPKKQPPHGQTKLWMDMLLRFFGCNVFTRSKPQTKPKT